jgi:hypothetical protein
MQNQFSLSEAICSFFVDPEGAIDDDNCEIEISAF